MKKIFLYLKLMRLPHYIKNILIFLPLIFSGKLLDADMLSSTVIGAIAFSLVCSVVYIMNDIADCQADRKHETKKNRPIASGEISIKNACILAIVLFLVCMILNVYIANKQTTEMYWLSFMVLYGYLIMNVAYSIKLKQVPILDITILALGFVLRVVYGSLITGIQISNWLYLTILAFSFYMGLGKRRNEHKKNGSESRKVLKSYNQAFLDNNMYSCMTIGIVFYSLWCLDISKTINSFISVGYTVPLVLIICMKYNLTIEGDSSGDPVDVVLGNKVLLLLALIYVITMFAIIYI